MFLESSTAVVRRAGHCLRGIDKTRYERYIQVNIFFFKWWDFPRDRRTSWKFVCGWATSTKQTGVFVLYKSLFFFFSVLHFGLWFPQRLRRDRLTLTFIFCFFSGAETQKPYRERERLSSSKNFFRCILCISFFLIVLCVFYETAGSGVGLHRPPTADAWTFLAPYITWAKRMKERKKKNKPPELFLYTHTATTFDC